MKAVYVQTPGGPENLIYGDLPKPEPGPGQALGKNRRGRRQLYRYLFPHRSEQPDPPVVLGNEGAGAVEAVGPGVDDLRPGDRVADAMSRGSMPSMPLCLPGNWSRSRIMSISPSPPPPCSRA